LVVWLYSEDGGGIFPPKASTHSLNYVASYLRRTQ